MSSGETSTAIATISYVIVFIVIIILLNLNGTFGECSYFSGIDNFGNAKYDVYDSMKNYNSVFTNIGYRSTYSFQELKSGNKYIPKYVGADPIKIDSSVKSYIEELKKDPKIKADIEIANDNAIIIGSSNIYSKDLLNKIIKKIKPVDKSKNKKGDIIDISIIKEKNGKRKLLLVLYPRGAKIEKLEISQSEFNEYSKTIVNYRIFEKK